VIGACGRAKIGRFGVLVFGYFGVFVGWGKNIVGERRLEISRITPYFACKWIT
jgi:hypothetical protein